MPCWATPKRRWPSNGNGLVTTATVKAPISLAAWAMTGAAPVPVPPPMPAVMNTISHSPRVSLIRPILSWAASRPVSGLAPAPRPLVSFSPSWILYSALECFRACISVFAVMKVTPFMEEVIMLFTALPPPPPTPTTLIKALSSRSSSKKSILPPSSIKGPSKSSYLPISIRTPDTPEPSGNIRKPSFHSGQNPVEDIRIANTYPGLRILPTGPVVQQTDGSGVHGAVDHVPEPPDPFGKCHPRGQVENLFPQILQPF